VASAVLLAADTAAANPVADLVAALLAPAVLADPVELAASAASAERVAVKVAALADPAASVEWPRPSSMILMK
jgi:hypothetical protein